MIAQFHICHSAFLHESILKIKISPSSSLSFPKLLQQYLGLFGNFVLMPRLPYQQTPRSGIQTGHRQGCVGRTGIVLMLGLHGPCRGVPGARRGRGQQMLLAPSSSLHGPAKHVNGKIKILIAEEEAFQDRCSGTRPSAEPICHPAPPLPAPFVAQVFIRRLPHIFSAAPDSCWLIFPASGFDSASLPSLRACCRMQLFIRQAKV